jgi:uncharacterized protein YecE (DUF72 family)
MNSGPLLHYVPSEPARTEYRVGLCAWQDRSMLEGGRFYPLKSMKAEERLWWYSRFFDCVEVNSTFYAPLSAQNAVLWVKRTPPGFLFSVKAYALLTGHHIDVSRLPQPLAEMIPASARPNERGQFENPVFPREAREWAFQTFQEALQPLKDAGKLGYLLFQLAPWVRYSHEMLDYLASVQERFTGMTVAVEFRDSSWLPGHGEEVLRFLAQHGLTYVSVDAPRVRAQIPSILALTSPTAVVRLHGRNAQGFMRQLRGEAPTVAEKYGYLYSEDELRKIVGKARELDSYARRVYLKLNNNREDFPALNGIQIKELLGLETPERTAVEAEWSRRRSATRSR